MDSVTQPGADPWTLVDLILVVGLSLSVLVGGWRGLAREMMALAGWGVAYFASQWFGPDAGAMVPIGHPGTKVNAMAGMIVVFALVWVTWALLSWAVIQVVRASVLSGPDRLFGAVFGLIRGVVVALVVVTLVSMTPVAKWAPWKDSRGVAALQVLLKGLRPVLPEQVLEFLPEQP